MCLSIPPERKWPVGTDNQAALSSFFDTAVTRPTLGVVYGRRRIGKSTLLVRESQKRSGFYFEATRVATPVQLERLGRALGEHLGVGRLAFDGWDEAVRALIRLGADGMTPVVLDEFGHILEADASVDSVIAAALGPGARHKNVGQARLILCGSAIAMIQNLFSGQAPLRGRAGLELLMQADDYRVAAMRLPPGCDLDTAVRVFAVIGGVVGYATDMVDHDLPKSATDFDRWVVQRVLSPSATLHHEATTLLAEDPTVAGKGALLHHSIFAGIANGSITAGALANHLGRQVPNIIPALNRLVDSGFVVRHEDPVRAQRSRYALNDPFLQFHYAVLEPNGPALRDRPPAEVWSSRLVDVFGSQVRGPVFEEQARTWLRRYVSASTLEIPAHIGPSSAAIEGVEYELDVVAAGPGEVPSGRIISAIGEAKAGEKITERHLRHLELARTAFGSRAQDAKLFLFGSHFDDVLKVTSEDRADVELVDLERLYFGS